MSLTKVNWGLIFTPTETAVNIADISASINTTDKYAGLMVWDTTNKRQLRAAGSLPESEWAVIDGSAQVIPA